MLGVVLVGCSGDPAGQPDPGTTSLEEAFDAAHPDGSIPTGIQGVEADRREVARRVAAVAGDVDVLLPRWLPDGFVLAAPYIAVGDGSARPNPEAWRDSYRVSYTDGERLLVMTVGAERRPAGFSLGRIDETMGGRRLLGGRSGRSVVVLTAGRPLVELRGEGVSFSDVVRVASSVAPAG